MKRTRRECEGSLDAEVAGADRELGASTAARRDEIGVQRLEPRAIPLSHPTPGVMAGRVEHDEEVGAALASAGARIVVCVDADGERVAAFHRCVIRKVNLKVTYVASFATVTDGRAEAGTRGSRSPGVSASVLRGELTSAPQPVIA